VRRFGRREVPRRAAAMRGRPLPQNPPENQAQAPGLGPGSAPLVACRQAPLGPELGGAPAQSAAPCCKAL